MSAPQQPGSAAQAPVAAPRHSLRPVPAPRRIRGPMLDKLAPCEAPCCVQARGGERPLGPVVPHQVPDDAEQAEQEGGEEPNPALPHLGQLC